jgi:hypothetical protein
VNELRDAIRDSDAARVREILDKSCRDYCGVSPEDAIELLLDAGTRHVADDLIAFCMRFPRNWYNRQADAVMDCLHQLHPFPSDIARKLAVLLSPSYRFARLRTEVAQAFMRRADLFVQAAGPAGPYASWSPRHPVFGYA